MGEDKSTILVCNSSLLFIPLQRVELCLISAVLLDVM